MRVKKKVLIAGFGSIGQRHLRNTRHLLPDAEIAVYRQHTQGSSQIPEGADAIFYDLQSTYEFSPDAVIISSPANLHIQNAQSYLAKGASIFIEKPLSLNAQDAADFVQSCAHGASFFMVGYVLRFLPALHAIRSLIRDGSLGAVLTAHVQVGQYLPDWRSGTDYRVGVSAQESLGGGALRELSHEIDYATWLFGLPDSLYSEIAKVSNLHIDVEDSAHILLNYDGPKRKVLIQLDFLQRVANMAVRIVGSEATLEADLIKETVRIISPEHPSGLDIQIQQQGNGNEIYLRQFDYFFSRSFPDYRPIFEETQNFSDAVSLTQGLDVMRIVDAARESSRRGQRIHLGEV